MEMPNGWSGDSSVSKSFKRNAEEAAGGAGLVGGAGLAISSSKKWGEAKHHQQMNDSLFRAGNMSNALRNDTRAKKFYSAANEYGRKGLAAQRSSRIRGAGAVGATVLGVAALKDSHEKRKSVIKSFVGNKNVPTKITEMTRIQRRSHKSNILARGDARRKIDSGTITANREGRKVTQVFGPRDYLESGAPGGMGPMIRNTLSHRGLNMPRNTKSKGTGRMKGDFAPVKDYYTAVDPKQLASPRTVPKGTFQNTRSQSVVQKPRSR